MMAKRKTITQLSDLTPDMANANKGTERGRYMVEASLTETGAGRSIVADKEGRIIAGNKTLEAWAGMGGAVKVVETDGQELVVVQRTDLDLSDPKGKARKLAYYDNRAGQVGLEWDAEQLLADVNAGVDLAAMFKADEIAELLAGVKGGAEVDAEPQIDQAAELNKKWQVKPGDLWRIGAHRLLCGDSTKAADVARVMGGEKAALMVTDPPYGVDYEGGAVNAVKREKLAGDESTDVFSPALLIAADHMPTGAWYVWHAGRRARAVYEAIEAAGYDVRALLIWNKLKPHYGAPSAHYCQKHEPCLYAVRGNADFTGPSNEVTVWDIEQPTRNEFHPTQKPLECMARAIRNHGKPGAFVYEPFAGSGTTLVACENLGRKCRAIEISADYCAVILERMAQAFPKLEITRDDGAG